MARVGARRGREGVVPRATGVPRLAKPARHARYAREVDPFRVTAPQFRLAFTTSHRHGRLGVSCVSRFVAPALPAATRRSRGHRTVQSPVRSRPEMYLGSAF